MNSKNIQTIENLKSDIQNILQENNPLDCETIISKHISSNYIFEDKILDYRISFYPPNISELREYKIQNILDDSFDHMNYQRPHYKWNIDLKLINQVEYIKLQYIKTI